MIEEFPELNLLERTSLMNQKELRAFLVKRREIDLKNLRSCKFDGFLVAMKCDLKMLDDINYRRSQTLIDEYKCEIDFCIIKRIVDLHSQVVQMEPQDQRLLLTDQYEYFSNKISKHIDRICSQNSEIPEVWLTASKWHFNLRSYERAKKILSSGIIASLDNLGLFTELFKLELAVAVKKHTSFDNAKKVFICIKNSNSMPSVKYLCSLVTLADDYDSSYQLQNEMIAKIKEFPIHSAYVWNFIAQREIMKKHYTANGNEIINEHTAWRNAWNILKEAIEKVPTVEMWRYYIRTALVTPEATSNDRYLIYKSGYEFMLKMNIKVLSDRDLIMLSKLEQNLQVIESILQKAVEEYPKSVVVWTEYMQFAIQMKDETKFESIFQRGINILQAKSLPLWQLKLDHVSSRGWDNHENFVSEIRNIYLNGIMSQHVEVSQKLIVNYLDWLVTQLGMPNARKAYYSLTDSIKSMICHSKMLELELISPTPVDEVIGVVLESALNQFGHTDITPWFQKIDYIKNKDPSQIEVVYNRAMAHLEPSKAKIFDIQFKLLQLKEH